MESVVEADVEKPNGNYENVEASEEFQAFDFHDVVQENSIGREVLAKLKLLEELHQKILKREELKPPTIWDVAIEQSAANRKITLDTVTTVYFVGSQQGGKTSLLNLFLERDQPEVEPTLALDFSFARKLNNATMEKSVCHFWELGGDPREWTNLIDLPVLNCHCLHRMSIFIVIDLSQPKHIWPVLEIILAQIKDGIKTTLAGMDRATAVEVSEKLDQNRFRRLGGKESSVDASFLEPSHLPIVIVGTKYDQFQNLEPDAIKTVVRVLRITAHLIGATLCFYSKDNVGLKRRFRELVGHYAFGTSFPKDSVLEPNQALLIPPGADTFEQIWASQASSQLTLDFCGHQMETKFGKIRDRIRKDTEVSNPALDPRFYESDIDRRRKEALEELDREQYRIPGF